MAKDLVGGSDAVFKTLGASNHTDADRQRNNGTGVAGLRTERRWGVVTMRPVATCTRPMGTALTTPHRKSGRNVKSKMICQNRLGH